jgi:hypothetical protein
MTFKLLLNEIINMISTTVIMEIITNCTKTSDITDHIRSGQQLI